MWTRALACDMPTRTGRTLATIDGDLIAPPATDLIGGAGPRFVTAAVERSAEPPACVIKTPC
jgi:hypothetical protein